MTGIKHKALIIFVITVAVLLTTSSGFAEELTFEEAVEVGLENNLELVRAQDNVKQLQRELKKIKTGSDWQVDVAAESRVNNFTDQILNTNDGDSNSKELDMSISATRKYWSGLTLQPEIYFSDDDLEAGQQEDAEFKFSVTQDLYPKKPIGAEQNYIQQELELKKAQAELADEKNNKIIGWVEQYLNLLRVKHKYNLAQQNYHLYQDELDEVLAQQKIGEAGASDLLQAKANLKEAQYQLENSRDDYQQSKKSLRNDLGLLSEQELKVSNNTNYLVAIRKIAASATDKLDKLEQLFSSAKESNQQFLTAKLNYKSAKYNLDWEQLEDKADVNLIGSYDSAEQKWQAGVSVAYNVFDSGKQEYETENLKQELDILQQEQLDIIKDIELKVEELVNQVKAEQTNLAAKKHLLEKAKLDKEIAKKQLAAGLIDRLKFNKEKIALEEAEINLKEAQDDLLISKLELIDYLGGELE